LWYFDIVSAGNPTPPTPLLIILLFFLPIKWSKRGWGVGFPALMMIITKEWYSSKNAIIYSFFFKKKMLHCTFFFILICNKKSRLKSKKDLQKIICRLNILYIGPTIGPSVRWSFYLQKIKWSTDRGLDCVMGFYLWYFMGEWLYQQIHETKKNVE